MIKGTRCHVSSCHVCDVETDHQYANGGEHGGEPCTIRRLCEGERDEGERTDGGADVRHRLAEEAAIAKNVAVR